MPKSYLCGAHVRDSSHCVQCEFIFPHPERTPLTSIRFVRSCLKLAKSDVLARDEKRAKIAVQVKPTTTKRLPDDTPALLEFLDAQVKRVGVVVGSLEQLGKRALAANEFDLDADARRKVRDAMTKWEGNVYAVTAGINFLRVAYPKLCDEHAAGVRAEFVDTVVTALKTHDLSSMLVQVRDVVMVYIAAMATMLDVVARVHATSTPNLTFTLILTQ